MGAKDLVVRLIDSRTASDFIRRTHYSGKVVQNSRVHFGVYWQGRLEGALQFGPSLDKSKVIGLVKGTGWNGFLELNRMAFSEALPRNSESRAISICLRLIRKHAPHVRWVISFADGTQCGDGTIYRASGFLLTGMHQSVDLARLPNGEVVHSLTLKSQPTKPRAELGGRSFFQVTGGSFNFKRYVAEANAELLKGWQLRYIYLLDPEARKDLTVPILPFDRIDAVGAGIYRGEKISRAERSVPQAREA